MNFQFSDENRSKISFKFWLQNKKFCLTFLTRRHPRVTLNIRKIVILNWNDMIQPSYTFFYPFQLLFHPIILLYFASYLILPFSTFLLNFSTNNSSFASTVCYFSLTFALFFSSFPFHATLNLKFQTFFFIFSLRHSSNSVHEAI